MTKSGGGNHLKRLVAPKHSPIQRKENKFTVKPSPGPHPSKECIPLTIVVRDILNYAKNTKEVKKIIQEKSVLVDGRARNNKKHPVGFMDSLSFPKIDKYYRMVYQNKGLRTVSISKEEAQYKLCQIKNKTTLKKGLTQINLHDGRNIIVSENGKEQSQYKTYDTVKISLPNQEILEQFESKIGNYALITSGRWMGTHGLIEDISDHGTLKTKTVTLRTPNNDVIETLFKYIFIIGKDSPDVSLTTEESD